jgi:hypothetical protein
MITGLKLKKVKQKRKNFKEKIIIRNLNNKIYNLLFKPIEDSFIIIFFYIINNNLFYKGEDMESLSNEYDELYEEAERFIKKYNPCKVENGTCLRFREIRDGNFCCRHCENLTEKGCSIKSLTCKTWFCAIAGKCFNEEAKNELNVLLKKGYDFSVYRGSKELSIKVAIQRRNKGD